MLVSIFNTQLNHFPCHYYCGTAAISPVKQPLVDLLFYPLENYPFLYLAIKEKSRKAKSGDFAGLFVYPRSEIKRPRNSSVRMLITHSAFVAT